jgi:hypothetical protein
VEESEMVFQIREAGFWDLSEDVVLELLRRHGGLAERALNALIDDDLGDLASVIRSQLSRGVCEQDEMEREQDAHERRLEQAALAAVGLDYSSDYSPETEEVRGVGSSHALGGLFPKDPRSTCSMTAEEKYAAQQAALAAVGLDDSDEEDAGGEDEHTEHTSPSPHSPHDEQWRGADVHCLHDGVFITATPGLRCGKSLSTFGVGYCSSSSSISDSNRDEDGQGRVKQGVPEDEEDQMMLNLLLG